MKITRRRFLGTAACGSVAAVLATGSGSRGSLSGAEQAASSGEVLYNGIRLPATWPPRNIPFRSEEPMVVPYLEPNQIPTVIPIDVGRQLFVDDFLIQSTGLQREFHQPVKYAGNPVLKPELDYEQPFTMLSAHPVWYDSNDRLFKMAYKAGNGKRRGCFLATSEDGLHWERPRLRAGKTPNLLFTEENFGGLLTTLSLVPHPTQPERGYVGLYGRLTANEGFLDRCDNFIETRDLLNWKELGTAPKSVKIPSADFTIHPYDVSRMFWNPFRQVWVYNIKQHKGPRKRCRFYRESKTFDDLWDVNSENTVFWVGADKLDQCYPGFAERYGIRSLQLYDHDAIAYESLMLGSFSIWSGPENDVCEKEEVPKVTQITMGYSRDGFHWHRPAREPFIGVHREGGPGTLDFGYVRPAGMVCVVVGDQLHFYYTSTSGVDPNGKRGIYAGRTVSLARLRRDGFASLNAEATPGTLVTRPVQFSGRHLFVNLDAPEGQLAVEVLRPDHTVVPGFSLDECLPVQGDHTLAPVRWRDRRDLSAFAGQPVKFRFHLQKGNLYSFWVSPDESGASYGYVAAGGPGYSGQMDTVGIGGLKAASNGAKS